MKKILTTMLLAAITIVVQGQQPNPHLTQLEDFLQKKDFRISYEQTNGNGGNTVHTLYISSRPRPRYMEEAMDSIRATFSRLGKKASESYMYEYHQKDIDTIKYSLTFRGEEDTIKSSLQGNPVWVGNAREAANVDYFRQPRAQGRFWEACSIVHSYSIPTGIKNDDLRCFDTVAFKAHIQPVFDKIKNLKGAKVYPTHWQHDRNNFNPKDFPDFWYTIGSNGKKIYPSGFKTGTHYFIPSQYKEEAKALYRQLNSLIHDYVNSHPEQYYDFNYRPSISRDSLVISIDPIFSGCVGRNSDIFQIYCDTDDDGNSHFFILNNEGSGKAPKEWLILKSYINGKKVYIKGKEPKKGKEIETH